MKTNLAKLPYLLLAILVVGSTLFYVASTAAIFDSFLNPHRARPPLEYSHNAHFLVQPLPESRRAGMEAEDEVISVNGVPFTGMAGLIGQTFHAQPGQTISILYRDRAGQHPYGTRGADGASNGASYVVRMADQHCSGAPLSRILPFARVLGGAGQAARLECLVSAGHHERGSGLHRPNRIFPRLPRALHDLLADLRHPMDVVSLILFSIYFPVRSRTDTRHPWIKWLIIVPLILIAPAQFAIEYGLLYHNRFIQPYLSATDPLEFAGNIFAAISLCIFIAAIVGKLFAVPAPAPDARRRLGVVAAGSLLGLGPVLVLLVTSTLSEKTVMETAPSWALLTVAVLFTFFPLSLAYTVIVQRALDLRIILRQGTRYAFARGTLWVLQVLVFTFLGFRIFHFAHTSGRGAQLIAPIVFVFIVLFLRLRIARPLSLWIDRRFFREAYSVDQVLVELSEQARSFTETEPLLRTITERISQTLHVERIAFLLRQGKLFQLQYAQGIPSTIDVSLAENSSTMRALAIDRSPKRVFREHPDPWLALAAPARGLGSRRSWRQSCCCRCLAAPA